MRDNKKMIKTKKDLKNTLDYEKNRYGNIPKLWFLFSLFGVSEASIIWKFQRRLRIWEYHLNKKHKIRTLILKAKTCSLGRKYGISIGPNVFDKGLKIMHLGTILIHNKSKVGINCVLHINTAFVSTNGIANGPVVGDNCAFGVGSILIGNILLGDNIVVGAGAVVTKSFPESHITIAGVPAKIVSQKASI